MGSTGSALRMREDVVIIKPLPLPTHSFIIVHKRSFNSQNLYLFLSSLEIYPFERNWGRSWPLQPVTSQSVTGPPDSWQNQTGSWQARQVGRVCTIVHFEMVAAWQTGTDQSGLQVFLCIDHYTGLNGSAGLIWYFSRLELPPPQVWNFL